MSFEIKYFSDLTVDEMYEIAKSRFEVFVCEQNIKQSSKISFITYLMFLSSSTTRI